MNAEVTRRGALDMQVCVPTKWTDSEAELFAERENPCGWVIRKQGDKLLNGDNERVPCVERAGFVHIMLDA